MCFSADMIKSDIDMFDDETIDTPDVEMSGDEEEEQSIQELIDELIEKNDLLNLSERFADKKLMYFAQDGTSQHDENYIWVSRCDRIPTDVQDRNEGDGCGLPVLLHRDFRTSPPEIQALCFRNSKTVELYRSFEEFPPFNNKPNVVRQIVRNMRDVLFLATHPLFEADFKTLNLLDKFHRLTELDSVPPKLRNTLTHKW